MFALTAVLRRVEFVKAINDWIPRFSCQLKSFGNDLDRDYDRRLGTDLM